MAGKERIRYFDVIKGIGILMIMYGHITLLPNPFDLWMSSFKVSLFFLVSGMLAYHTGSVDRADLSAYARKNFQSIMVPYFAFGALGILFKTACAAMRHHTAWYVLEQFRSLSMDLIFLRGYNSIWFLPVLFIGMIILNPIMNRTSKTMPVRLAFPLRILATLVLLAFSYEGVNFTIILVLSFIIGLGTAASSVTIYAILADMADVDELITTIHRPGICSSMATFIRKIATGLSSAVIGILLAIVGYNEELANEGLRQTAATQHGVALIYVFAPVVLMVLTLILVFKFPLGKKEFGVVQRDLARRKGENKTIATEEERYILERVTGFTYEALWNIDNARGFEKTGKA